MRPSLKALALAGLLIFAGGTRALAQAAGPCRVFVATNGNDANPGTENQPFASLDHARDYVRFLKLGAVAPIQVCLRGGTYELQHTFTLGPGDSGTAAAPITYRSYPGEQAILSGGVQLHPNWSVYSGQIQVAQIDQWFNQLFVNGVRATRARTPNADANFFQLAPVANLALQTSSFVYEYPSCPACPTTSNIPTGMHNSDMEIVSIERFVSPRQRVASTDGTTLTVEGTIYPDTITGPPEEQGYGTDYARNDRYYIENSLGALDSPGEWYLDESAHKLYYWPRNPDEIRDGVFVAPQLHQLVRGGSYQANSGWQAAAVAQSYFVSCHHLGVYSQDPGSLSFGQSSFTVAMWLQFPGGAQDPFWVFSKGDPQGNPATGAGGLGYGLSTQSTLAAVPVRFFVNDGSNRISVNLPAQPRGAWVHAAFVIDRTAKQMRAYLNGVLANTQDISALGSIASATPLDVGAYTNQSCSNSAVGDFRIYASALSPAQVSQVAAGAASSIGGLALWLPFNGDFIDHSMSENETVVFFAPQFTAGTGGAMAADFSMPFPSDVSGSADYVGFSGLTFEYADWVIPFTGFTGSPNFWTSPAAVYLHSRNASVAGNTFLHLGSDALGGMMANSLVENNVFSDVGGGAIKIGDSPPTPVQETVLAPFVSGNTVKGNQISDTGIVDRDSFVLWVAQGANNTICRNTVSKAPFIGIASAADPGFGWPSTGGGNHISLNLIDNVMQLLNDGSGIYVNGTQVGTVIDRNVIHDVLKTPAHLFPYNIWGIYLDGTSNSFKVTHNLTYRTEYGGIMLNSYPDNANNTVTNNIFVDGVEYQITLLYASKDSFTQNIVYDGQSAGTRLFFDGGGVYPLGANSIQISDYNLFFGPSVPSPTFADQLMSWQSFGFDKHSIVADPQFVDYAHDNFTLRPSSPALLPMGGGGIGFQPIDFSGLP